MSVDNPNKAELRRLVEELREDADVCAGAGHEYELQDRAADAIRSLLNQCDGLLAQHGRDSATLRKLCQDRDDAKKERKKAEAERDAALAELEACRKDAERYRWLRGKVGVERMYGDFTVFLPSGNYGGVDQGVTDQSIDAAMSQEANHA